MLRKTALIGLIVICITCQVLHGWCVIRFVNYKSKINTVFLATLAYEVSRAGQVGVIEAST